MPWASRLFKEGPAIVEGMLVVPDKPGLGLEFDRDAIRRFAISA
jgi:L-alanine-DL-glutamate epimerase-like enolase superfamily enzyme